MATTSQMLRCLWLAQTAAEISDWPTALELGDAVQEAVIEGYLEQGSMTPVIPRWGVARVNLRITPEGRTAYYRLLPGWTEPPSTPERQPSTPHNPS